MKTHEQVTKALLRRPAVRAEVERIEREEGAKKEAASFSPKALVLNKSGRTRLVQDL